MTNCKKQPSLTRDCDSDFRDPYSIDIDGTCKKSTSRKVCDIIVSKDNLTIIVVFHYNLRTYNKEYISRILSEYIRIA